jgi:transposase InsO family protein
VREIGQVLGRPLRTLRDWRSKKKENDLAPKRRGRPPVRSPREDRQALLDVIEEEGAHVGAAPLQAHFPKMPKREIESHLARVRDVHRRRGSVVYVLEWRPGAVWAMDHTTAPVPIVSEADGGCEGSPSGRAILAVRDLGSGRQHLWRLVEDESGSETVRALEQLLAEHPAPIAMKMDGGPGFCSVSVRLLLAMYGILALVSPPRSPSYNGSIEAANGSLKKRTAHRAMREGRIEMWTEADLEWALAQANERGRPWGASGPTPEEKWQETKPMDESERAEVWREVIAEYGVLIREGTTLPGGAPGERIRELYWRRASVKVLIARRILKVRRRVIHPRIRTKRTAKIT